MLDITQPTNYTSQNVIVVEQCDNWLIKLFMSTKSPSFKLGVLNMAICFEKPPSARKLRKDTFIHQLKNHPVPCFIPRYSTPRQKVHPLTQRADDQLSPYQFYRKTHKESIRYFKEHTQLIKNSTQISGLSPQRNKTIQLEYTDGEPEEEQTCPAKKPKDNHLKLVFNKRHLRNTIDSQPNQYKAQHFAFNLQGNPQESLKTIFTVRAAKTSERYYRKVQKSPEKIINDRIVIKHKMSRQVNRKTFEQQFSIQKKLRPWSPTRNFFSKDMFQSQIMQPVQTQRLTIT